MVKDPLIKVFDKAKDIIPASARIIELEIDIAGEMIQLQIHVMDGQMTLADIVTLAQTVAEKIIEIIVAKTQSNGDVISCGKECSPRRWGVLGGNTNTSVPQNWWSTSGVHHEIVGERRRHRHQRQHSDHHNQQKQTSFAAQTTHSHKTPPGLPKAPSCGTHSQTEE